MAGFEVIVRPVILPNIRPTPARALAPEDNPDQGIAVLSGTGGKLIDLPRQWSVSSSKQNSQTETRRQVDKKRVHQVDEKGNINKQNYIDVETLKKVRLETNDGPVKLIFADPPDPPNVERLQTDVTKDSSE
jgi:hypothetical protein